MKPISHRKSFRSPATLATVALAAGSGPAMSAVLFSAPYQVNPPPNGVDIDSVGGVEAFGVWTGNFINVTLAGTRTVDTTSAPASLVLALTDTSFSFSVNTFGFFATVADGAPAGSVSFDYAYTETTDAGAQAKFSYLKNGTATELASGPASNTVSFAVNPGDTFGFQLSGGYGANASVTITNFTAPVPEPSALLLLATGFTGLVGMRRRRQQAA